ncbi:MAG: hypothetical protein AAGA75_13165 [Cyanobacteria bacterium P01_E01_bin.6]
MIRWARVFAGGERAEDSSPQSGQQVAIFPAFVYSLREHQWIIPGYSETEGTSLKSSWAYQFNESNFGGVRFDLTEQQGVGIGFLHDYRLPIASGIHFGRAQLYWLTESGDERTSSRIRLAHRFDLPLNRNHLQGQVDINVDNTVRPAGGRNDRANFRVNTTYSTPLSLTTVDVSRFGFPSLDSYTLPITLNHSQRISDIDWFRSNARLNFINSQFDSSQSPTSSLRWHLSAIASPDWGRAFANYRGLNSSTDDLEARQNFDFSFSSAPIRLGAGISLIGNMGVAFNQVSDPNTRDFLQHYRTTNAGAILRFSPISIDRWLTINPNTVQYDRVFYSTGNGESALTINPNLLVRPTRWSQLDVQYYRAILGNNSVPFDIPSRYTDRHRLEAELTLKTPNATVNAPPEFIAFEDDLPGESPIPLVFEDDTIEDIKSIEEQQLNTSQSPVSYSLRLDAYSGYDFAEQRWEYATADFSLSTSPTLLNLNLFAGYDPNDRELLPIILSYGQRSSTTFDRNLRSGLDSYEPGLSYSLQAAYDPIEGELRYGINTDLTLGNRWQNHWRIRLRLNHRGVDFVEVRRDLRDFELRFVADPRNELFRMETVLVAFPTRPVGLTQQRGQFFIDSSPESLNYDTFNRFSR